MFGKPNSSNHGSVTTYLLTYPINRYRLRACWRSIEVLDANDVQRYDALVWQGDGLVVLLV